MSPKHQPTVIWPARPIGESPQAYVRTTEGGGIEVMVFDNQGARESIEIPTRRMARMVARRINQCLDYSK